MGAGETIAGSTAGSHHSFTELASDDPALVRLTRIVDNLAQAVLRLAEEVEELQRRS